MSTDVVGLLADLVSRPSVNPMGRDLSGPGILERDVTDYLVGWCRERDIPYTRDPIAEGRDNLLIRYNAPGSRRTLLFDAHQDTVPVDGMTIPPFEPTIADDRMSGRGSCDVKAGLAAMLCAVERLHRDRPAGSASVILACTVDEEYTHKGSSRLAKTLAGDIDLAIVAEPTRLEVVNCHKGAVRWKARARGVACHSSTPHRGVNAIYRMATVLRALEEYARELGDSRPHPVLGPPSLSVGRIEGGLSANVVPDWCTIEIDRRVLPGEHPDDIPGIVRAMLDERLGPSPWLEFDPPWVRMPALDSDNSEPWLGMVRDIVGEVLGAVPAVSGVPYGTDAGPLNAAGVASLVIGPGDIAQAHTKDEWIELDQVRRAVDVYEAIARGLG